MLFYLSALNLARFMTRMLLSSKKMSVVYKSSTWLMHGSILTSYTEAMNSLIDSLYNEYSAKEMGNEL